MNDLDSILKKVRALRTLALKNSNLHEAQAAAAQADLLIQKHRLSEAQVEVDSASSDRAVLNEKPLYMWKERKSVWKERLVTVLTSQYGCIWLSDWSPRYESFALFIIGRTDDMEILRHMFAWLTITIVTLGRRLKPLGEARAWLASFYLGAVDGYRQALLASMATARKDAQPGAIIKLDERRKEAERQVQDLFPNEHLRETSSSTEVSNWKGYTAGVEQGHKLHGADKKKLKQPHS